MNNLINFDTPQLKKIHSGKVRESFKYDENHRLLLATDRLSAFDQAVNTTLGLPFIRTSPDHGTAFDIAGKGDANPTSMLAALQTGWELSKMTN